MRRQPDPHYFHVRRAIRGAAGLLLAVLIIFLVADDLKNARAARDKAAVAEALGRENQKLLEELKAEQTATKEATVNTLVEILALVQQGEETAAEEGRRPGITTERAIEALRRSFPPEVVDEAVQRSAGEPGPQGPPGPPGPAGPPGADAGGPGTTSTTTTAPATTTSTTTTTTTTRRCLLELPPLASIGCS